MHPLPGVNTVCFCNGLRLSLLLAATGCAGYCLCICLMLKRLPIYYMRQITETFEISQLWWRFKKCFEQIGYWIWPDPLLPLWLSCRMTRMRKDTRTETGDLISSQSLNLGGRRGTTDDVATIPFYLSLSSATLRESPNSIPVHYLMLSSHLFCLPLLAPVSQSLAELSSPCQSILRYGHTVWVSVSSPWFGGHHALHVLDKIFLTFFAHITNE